MAWKNKEDQKAYNRAYYLANREKWKEYAKKQDPEKQRENKRLWAAKNVEKKREQNREWDRKNPEKRRAMNESWAARNPEKRREYSRTSYAKNPEKRIEYSQAWAAKNPDRVRTRHTRKAAKRRGGLTSEKFLDVEIFERDKWTCQFCYKPVDPKLKGKDPDAASIDHIVPFCEGGVHAWDNCQLLHVRCNGIKGRRLMPHFAMFG